MDAAALKTAESYEGDLRDRSAVLEWLETFALKERRPASSAKKEEKPNLKKAPSKAKKSDEKANESESEDSVEEEKKDS